MKNWGVTEGRPELKSSATIRLRRQGGEVWREVVGRGKRAMQTGWRDTVTVQGRWSKVKKAKSLVPVRILISPSPPLSHLLSTINSPSASSLPYSREKLFVQGGRGREVRGRDQLRSERQAGRTNAAEGGGRGELRQPEPAEVHVVSEG